MKKDIIITIFGATGDLTMRKLLPALASLVAQKAISSNLLVVAVGRKPYNTESYLNECKKTIDTLPVAELSTFVQYQQMEITSGQDYALLKSLIDANKKTETIELHYLATSPALFEEVARHLHSSGIVAKSNARQRIVFEKPFGNDLKSAKQINKLLWQFFSEEQIYRIDHYLGKEMIQNIMTMRFANRIYEAVWSNKHIKSITIFAKETLGILNRGAFYEQAGALKDMVQSHLMQVLALIAMEPPKTYFSKDVKNAKVKVLKRTSFLPSSVVFGQYQGYLSEQHVAPNSVTETYVSLQAHINTKRFKGVPIYIVTGKKLAQKESGILIEFKETKEQRKWHLPLVANKLQLEIAPVDGVKVWFNSKVPGLRNMVQPFALEYDTKKAAVGNIPEAYERLILDALEGFKTLFTRWDEIELMWKLTDKIKSTKRALVYYKSEQDLLK